MACFWILDFVICIKACLKFALVSRVFQLGPHGVLMTVTSWMSHQCTRGAVLVVWPLLGKVHQSLTNSFVTLSRLFNVNDFLFHLFLSFYRLCVAFFCFTLSDSSTLLSQLTGNKRRVPPSEQNQMNAVRLFQVLGCRKLNIIICNFSFFINGLTDKNYILWS